MPKSLRNERRAGGKDTNTPKTKTANLSGLFLFQFITDISDYVQIIYAMHHEILLCGVFFRARALLVGLGESCENTGRRNCGASIPVAL